MDENNVNQTKKKKRKYIPLRLNVLFLIIFIAFSALILRLGVVQIVHGQEYTTALKKTQNVTTKVSSARGLIFGTNGTLLAGNKAELAVVFTRNPDQSSQDLINLAKKLSKYINVSTKKDVPDGKITTADVTERDMKDYWITTHPNVTEEKLTAKEFATANKDKAHSKAAYQMVLDRIGDKELSQISDQQMKTIAIWRMLEQATNLTPKYITTQLTKKELAQIGEHLNEFGGTIDTGVAATRQYPEGDLFFLGNVKQIPKNEVNNFVAKGYNLNDLVGTSNLEEQYQNVLHGVPTTYRYTTQDNKPVGTPIKTEGRRGDDLVLTLNLKLQKKVGSILEKEIKSWNKKGAQAKTAYAVVMDPNTGAILSMDGRTLDPSTGKFKNTSAGTILSAFQIGSSIKGATLLAGYQNHALPGGPNHTLNDKPIRFKHGNTFSSYTSNIGVVNPAQALQHSSNVYMGTIAGDMAGFQFTNTPSHYDVKVFNGSKYVHAFKTLRDAYSQFGLGVQTGVDLPFESTGFDGGIPTEAGKIMQFAIGQFDTYTPLQMAQYVSTIANGGYRLAPHLLKSVHAPSKDPNQIGPTVRSYEPKVLDTIPNTKAQMATVHKGFYLVTHASNGTAPQLGHGSAEPYKIAAKTGTAQLAPKKSGWYNLALVGYAPYDNPQVAVSIMVPHVRDVHINLDMGEDIFKAYFDDIVKHKPK